MKVTAEYWSWLGKHFASFKTHVLDEGLMKLPEMGKPTK